MNVYTVKYNYPDIGGAVVSGIDPEHAYDVLKLWWEYHTSCSYDIPTFRVSDFDKIQYLDDRGDSARVIFQTRSLSK